MKIVKLILGLTGILLLVSCQKDNFKVLDDGIVISLHQRCDQQPKLVKLQVITENIIHVSASPIDSFAQSKSLIVEEKELPKADWSVEREGDKLILKTAALFASISLSTGEVTFSDKNGRTILQEIEGGGKSFFADTLSGQTIFKIRQIFDSPGDEAFYGLGQHQDNILNYKGHNVELMQQNMIAVIPFLASSRNYGILWDNYSITRFGDPREYQNINTLKLFSEEENEGGLTAKYMLNSDSLNPFVIKTEDKIDFTFRGCLEDLPDGYSFTDGYIEWSGYLESDEAGVHKFQLYSSAYSKVWIEGELVVDAWRQWWLPWTNYFDINMEQGKKYSIKIKWNPGGHGELSNGPYMALKYLSPVEPKQQNNLSLYSEVADNIDYYFIYGNNLDRVISGYRTLTGKATLMPKWAMGLWQSRERYQTQDQLLDVVKEYRKRQIPLDNIVLDWFYWRADQWGSHEFDPARFPDPEGMISTLHEKYHTQIMISVWPKFYEGIDNYKLFDQKGWLYKKNIELRSKDWIGYVSTYYDAFNPGARKLFWDLMNKKLYSKGIDAWWMDATEPEILSNISNYEKSLLMDPTYLGPGARYMNAYSLLNSKGVYEGQRRVNPDQRVFILTRSAFAGQQRYASATWSGDLASTWYDMQAQIPAGINFSLSGIPYWTFDIGGFAVERRYENATGENLDEWRELMTRWFQFGAFCPLFRIHGQYPYREIYNVAPKGHIAYETMVRFDKLRYSLMPYIYSLAGMAYHDDYTIMRGLLMDFPGDTNVCNLGDQYMFGPAILVNPVYSYKATSRNVYLPVSAGWYDLYSGKYYKGGQTINADAPLSKMPLFVKSGSILLKGPEKQYTMEKPANPITVFIYRGKEAVFTLYEDEGTNYNYEKGIYSEITFIYNDELNRLIIGDRMGSYPGMLENRIFDIITVSDTRPISFEEEPDPDIEIEYSGQRVDVELP
jgi:alpha-D-xyloside xylohydrolase